MVIQKLDLRAQHSIKNKYVREYKEINYFWNNQCVHFDQWELIEPHEYIMRCNIIANYIMRQLVN